MNKIISSHISVINAVNIRSRFNKKNESIVIHKLLEKCNEFSKNNNLGMTFDINELKQILHKMWKQEIITFSMK